jgi:cbb3-type cytochrome oxidase subunit 3
MKDHMVLAGLFTISMAATLGNRWILLALSLVFLGGWLFTFARAMRSGELRRPSSP